jgi:hypothetical protein
MLAECLGDIHEAANNTSEDDAQEPCARAVGHRALIKKRERRREDSWRNAGVYPADPPKAKA